MASYNVVDDYDWALNKGVDVPYVKLREMEYDGSPSADGYAHFVKYTLELPMVSEFKLPCIADKLLGAGKAEAKNAWMKPYAGLYRLKPTGNTFKFPYMESNVYDRTNSWGPSYGGDEDNILANMGAAFTKGINKYSSAGGFGVLKEPGIFVERTMFYQASDAAPSPLNFTFPLLNTQSEGGISKNMELIKLLAKNTSPSRESKSVLHPPKLYEARVPGIKYIEYGFISPYTVSMLGTRRMVGGKIVPEAFQISISVQSLTDESGNFLIQSQQR